MEQTPHDLRQIEALLDFYTASGVDCFLGDEPADWFELTSRQAAERAQSPAPAVQAPQGRPPRQPDAPAPAPAPASRMPAPEAGPQARQPAMAPATAQTGAFGQPGVLPDREIIEAARDLASSAATLEDLRQCLEAFDGCNLKLTAKRLVFADGNPQARLMFVGEAPGRDEDLQGKPFVGRSGQLLDRMLEAIGLDRSSVYIANVVPWRPPGNRTPTPQETEICKPFIRRQVELVKPDVLVFLGAASAKTLLGVQDGIRKMRGRWMTYPANGGEIAAVATYHPAYLLRSPLEKRLSWRDFLAIRQRLNTNA
ncbi:uracil-DNA glycosylase [Roseibium salinum]|uniref:Type-4 uracil-DNA glycosylase n=1 Tax=Roseibium salinum TaxID=1604349 RepID=A0ABT3R3L7_9HYPH|nr:uracil-DNA glycosylase [Roseibium sp. DSM 29163]MCX2723764.1 uracil-DNA glycosylase [Roseibium sp. DSM 29163]